MRDTTFPQHQAAGWYFGGFLFLFIGIFLVAIASLLLWIASAPAIGYGCLIGFGGSGLVLATPCFLAALLCRLCESPLERKGRYLQGKGFSPTIFIHRREPYIRVRDDATGYSWYFFNHEDPEAARAAKAYLDKRGLAVSIEY